ncbi:hypothetical protein [Microvirga pakistanensis]|uniref:hypothetical protein n=1 Tax=Microvirga pakistanensis TaxID=1682650 RepID=UPI001069A325|nr:hypothetical protein [Microvirga pakistanensis]
MPHLRLLAELLAPVMAAHALSGVDNLAGRLAEVAEALVPDGGGERPQDGKKDRHEKLRA